MAKQSGLGDNFYIGGYDLSGDVASVDQLSSPMTTLNVTPVNVYGNARIGGLRDGDMQFTTFFEYSGSGTAPSFPGSGTAITSTYYVPAIVTITGGTVSTVDINGSSAGSGDGSYLLPALGSIAVDYTGSPSWTWSLQGTEHDALSPLPRTSTIASYFRGTTLLNPTASLYGLQLNYDPTRDNTGNLTMKVEVMANGYGLEWGVMLTAGLRTDTTATTGSYVDDNGAGTTYGAQAHLQIIDFEGTSVDVQIQDCTTSGGSYTSLIDFGSQTGPGAWRGTVSGTVDRYLKVVTSGTFTYVTFAVAWTRNQFAVNF